MATSQTKRWLNILRFNFATLGSEVGVSDCKSNYLHTKKGEHKMNQPKFILAIALAVSAVLTGATGVFAQKVDPSYDVSLQVIVGSNDSSQRGEIPANLAGNAADPRRAARRSYPGSQHGSDAIAVRRKA